MDIEKYERLKNRIETLKAHFNVMHENNLNPEISSEEEDYIRAFRLLCHAEIENYIEDLAKSLIEDAKAQWRQQKIANYNLASLYITSAKIDSRDTVTTKSMKIISDYIKTIESNHGIKDENIKKLFSPLGYEIDDFDVCFISNLSAYGSARGLIAHTSATAAAQIQQALNFTEEKQKVDDIIQGLEGFQNALDRIANGTGSAEE